MTKQEDFLEHLKDPTKGYLKQAAKDFLADHKNSLSKILVTESEYVKNGFTVSVMATNHGILLVTSIIFVEHYLRKHLPNLLVNRSAIVEKRNDLFVLHYNVRLP